jgi:hypothetical protein
MRILDSPARGLIFSASLLCLLKRSANCITLGSAAVVEMLPNVSDPKLPFGWPKRRCIRHIEHLRVKLHVGLGDQLGMLHQRDEASSINFECV